MAWNCKDSSNNSVEELINPFKNQNFVETELEIGMDRFTLNFFFLLALLQILYWVNLSPG